jgi:spore coat polysaccharide biosynthesis predicted glycosyltransferase SpsG
MRKHLEPHIPGLKKILVFFTAGDDKGETIKAMQGIQMFGNIEQVDVVIGQSNLNNKEINQICDKLHWGLHSNINYMPKLIAQADLAIGAGGSSNWERCALGVPALVTILADNQEPIAEALGRAGVVFNLGWSSNLKAQDYANALGTLSQDRLKAMSEKALAIVDARGSERMADILLAA